MSGPHFQQICNEQLPGVCCRPPAPDIINFGTKARFEHLHAGDIAVVWNGRNIPGVPIYITGCSGRVVETRVGPAAVWEHRYDAQFPSFGQSIYGANYLSHPRGNQLPPSPAMSQWLNIQGFRELVWGGGQWFAKGGGELVRKRFAKRGIVSENKGTAYFTSPKYWKYADLIVVNGTNYTDDDRGDLIYRSDDGAVLNLDLLKG